MQAATHLSVKLPILFTLAVLVQSSFAQELPNLPESFDAGWKGEKDLSNIHQNRLNAVARRLNEKPRETLKFETSAERFNQCVASTG
jgi:hypothetical protein